MLLDFELGIGSVFLYSTGAVEILYISDPSMIKDRATVMIELIVGASVPLLEAWESMLDDAGGSKEIDVDGYLRNFSADVIARACFGSDFTTGEEIFHKLRQLQKAISQQDTLIGLSAVW
ncbi:hypothetical protein TRIUR3_06519 [Triticum urartu]|uniref:Uncharacterized protein n=1 Tax=Triticum urartu TaxID=4572 RepID=M7ZSB3_TRIUA|nr:hypothetical protein TRIUR3_06519 [Triticum urartu]